MHNHHNGLKTAFLMGSMVALLTGIGWLLSVFFNSSGFLYIFGLFSIGSVIYSYWNSDKIAIRAMRAVEVTPAQAPTMHKIVSELSQRANQPMPRLFIAPTMTPNAFATGRNPDHAAVCCTEGILRMLNERELRGVLGHELMHVYNRDILTSSIAAGVASLISTMAQIMSFGTLYGRNSRDGGNPLAAIAIAIFAPLLSMLIQMAISRTREFDADEDGAKLTEDPMALASALRKIERGVSQAPMQPTPQLVDSSHMMIANPFAGQRLRRLIATHPPMNERVDRLYDMAASMGQTS